MISVDSICEGGNTLISPNITLGSPPYSYNWSPILSGLSNDNILSPNANPTTTTTYTLNVIDNNFCNAFDTIKIEVLQNPIVSAGNDQVICENDTAFFMVQSTVDYLLTPSIGHPKINSLIIPR